jgi:hypothetical protein
MMAKRASRLALLGFVLSTTLWAADDGLVGKWKLNPSKSTLTDQMKVESAGGNKYVLDFGGGSPETIAADGTDQPGNYGTTFAITVAAPDKWKGVRKKDGRVLLTGIWTLSKDGNSLTDDFTSYRPDGSQFHLLYVYKRVGAGQGFVGMWESASEQVNSAYEMEIGTFEGDGLSFVTPGVQKHLHFDGKDYANEAPDAPPGYTSSGRHADDGSLELTDKINGKVIYTQQIMLSSDRKTLTVTVHRAGGDKPNVQVFDREQ